MKTSKWNIGAAQFAKSILASALFAFCAQANAYIDPALQLQNDFHKTRLGGSATCTESTTLVTCKVPSTTQLISESSPDSDILAMALKSVGFIQNDIIKVNPVTYAQVTCILLDGSLRIGQYEGGKYGLFSAVCYAPLPFPT